MPRQRQTEYIEVEGTEAVIFRRGDIWYMRVRMPGSGDYHKASCKTKNKTVAIKKCRKQYFGYDALNDAGIVVTRRTMADLIDQMVANMERLVKIQQLSSHMLTIYRSKANVLRTYWAKWMPGEVTAQAWNEYIAHRLETGKSHYADRLLSPITLRHERMTMQRVLEVALTEKLISHLPILKSPVQKAGTGVRPSFSLKEIEILELWLAQRMGYPDEPYYRERRYLYLYIQFMRYTGLRTNDMRLLRLRDVEIHHRPCDGQEVLAIRARGKGKDRVVISQSDAVEWWRNILKYHGHLAPDALVWPNQTGTGPKKFDGIMRRTLISAGLLKDEKGLDRSPYCLRHHYAMQKVERGVYLHDLADNMGCGMPVLSRYYTNHAKALERIDQRSA
jgi:site-specific recombinase XerD